MKITYIGHATLLLEIQGLWILTDPNFETRLGKLLPRVAAPGIAIHRLPRLDALLLSHAHADHLSFKSLDQLPQDIPLFAPPAIARWLTRKGYGHAVSLAPNEVVTLGDGSLRIHAGRAVHEGSRYGFDRWRSDANMYVVESSTESLFFAGDTALTDATHSLVEQVIWAHGRQLDVALLPIGYAPAWKPGFRRGHLTSRDALRLFDILRAQALIPYHWGTFRHVTATAYDAINRFRKALVGHDGAARVHILKPGESYVHHAHDNHSKA